MQNSQDTLKDIESLLEFYGSAGVDCFLGDAPVDWAEASARQAVQRQQAVPAPRPPQKTAAPVQTGMPAHTTPANAPRQPAAAPRRPPVRLRAAV
ncbi:MAG: hypothetical protein AAGF82_19065, partial [Pseudomonadota bacterium]